MNSSSANAPRRQSYSIVSEFGFQLVLATVTCVLGWFAAYLQHGLLVQSYMYFPLAGVSVPIWHLVWMGFWTGYVMAIVGQAAGVMALPYSMSVLQFTNVHITPTTQLLTLLNPIGALLGFRTSRQWNSDLALWLCLGGIFGGLAGPFVRLIFLSETKLFSVVVGAALGVTGFHLIHNAATSTRQSSDIIVRKFAVEAAENQKAGHGPAGLPFGTQINTVSRIGRYLTIEFWEVTWTFDIIILCALGATVGLLSTAIGLGGGFLLVPILMAYYSLPVYVVVAATIPYGIVLSAVSLLTYSKIAPALTGISVQPEWAWGFLAAGGGILGSWCAAKTQRYVSHRVLEYLLGAITFAVGTIYIVNFFE